MCVCEPVPLTTVPMLVKLAARPASELGRGSGSGATNRHHPGAGSACCSSDAKKCQRNTEVYRVPTKRKRFKTGLDQSDDEKKPKEFTSWAFREPRDLKCKQIT